MFAAKFSLERVLIIQNFKISKMQSIFVMKVFWNKKFDKGKDFKIKSEKVFAKKNTHKKTLVNLFAFIYFIANLYFEHIAILWLYSWFVKSSWCAGDLLSGFPHDSHLTTLRLHHSHWNRKLNIEYIVNPQSIYILIGLTLKARENVNNLFAKVNLAYMFNEKKTHFACAECVVANWIEPCTLFPHYSVEILFSSRKCVKRTNAYT